MLFPKLHNQNMCNVLDTLYPVMLERKSELTIGSMYLYIHMDRAVARK